MTPTLPPILPLASSGGVYSPSDPYFTIEDILVLPRDLPSGTVDYELQEGRLIVVPLPGESHAAASSNIVTELKIQGERKGHGKARDAVGVVFPRTRDTLRGPDAIFIANRNLPIRIHQHGKFWESNPDLFVEILSPSNTKLQIEMKVELYLEEGVKVVWVLDPDAKTVAEHRTGGTTRVWQTDEFLQIPDVIPDFSVLVERLFSE